MSAPATPPPGPDPKHRTRARLLFPLAFIVIAIAALALFERFRHAEPAPPAPHEPSQALITPPQPPHAQPAEGPATPPPPPVVVNEPDAAPLAATTPVRQSRPEHNAYLVQAGVFTSAANAQALQQRLANAGVRAKIETRVQLGPYKDRRDAEQALAKLRKLGVNAVMVPAR